MKERKSKDKKADYRPMGRKTTKARAGFVKPLSKQEAKEAEDAHISKDEFRYRQACSWAILMGEELPNKDKFMADLQAKRARAKAMGKKTKRGKRKGA